MSCSQKFGKRIRSLRKSIGLTQSDLAAKIGISLQHLSSIERSLAYPSFNSLEKMAHALLTTVADLFLVEPLQSSITLSAKAKVGNWGGGLVHQAGSLYYSIAAERMCWSDSLYVLCGCRKGRHRPTLRRLLGVFLSGSAAAEEAFEAALSCRSQASVRITFSGPDGSVSVGLLQLDVLDDTRSRDIVIHGSILDLTSMHRLVEGIHASRRALEDRLLIRNISSANRSKERCADKISLILETIFNASHSALAFVDNRYTYQTVNRKYEEIFGIPKESIIGRSVCDLFGQTIFQSFLKPKIDRALTGETIHYQQWMKSPVLGDRFFRVSYSPVVLDERIWGYVVSANDVTDLEEARQKLLLKNSLADSSTTALAICDLKGNLAYVNPAFLRLWGMEGTEEALGRYVTEFWADADEAAKVLSRLIAEEQWDGWLQARRKDGKTLSVKVHGHSVRDQSGEIMGYAASFQDESGRLASELVLCEKERNARAMLNATTDIAVLLSRDGVVLDFNDRFAQHFTMTCKTPHGRNISDILPAAVAVHRMAIVKEVVATGSPYRTEEMLCGVWNVSNYCPVLDDAGEVAMVAIFSHDTSILKNKIQQLQCYCANIRGVLDASQEAILVIDRAGIVREVNKAFAHRIYATRKTLLGSNLRELCANQMAGRWLTLAEKVFTTGQKSMCLDCHGEFTLELFAAPSKSDYGKVTQVALFARDITDKIALECQLQVNREKLERALHAGVFGVWEIDFRKGDINWSTESATITGLSKGELPRTYEDFLEITYPEDRALLQDAINRASACDEGCIIKHRILLPDGGLRLLTDVVGIHRDNLGNPKHVYGVFRDTTEQCHCRQLEAPLA